MKNITINDVADDSSSFSCLPEEIALQILSKLVDFKTLCLCKLVSKRFSRIVLQVDTILFTSFTDPALDLPVASSSSSYWSAISCLKKFGNVKSLCIQHPSSFDTDSLFKWKIKFGNRLDSILFLSPNSIYHNKELYDNINGHEQEEVEDWESENKKLDILEQCLKDVLTRIKLLLPVIKSLPLLEKVTIGDSGKRGKVFLSGEKVVEMRNSLLHSLSETVKHQLLDLKILRMTCKCYVPLLKLPVSGYVMKGVTLFLLEREDLVDGINSFLKSDNDDPEDKEEAAYSEVVMEICKKHRGSLIMQMKLGA